MDSFAAINLNEFLSSERADSLLRIALLVLVIWPLIFLAGRAANRMVRKRVSAQSSMLIRRAITYIGSFIIIFMVMRELGFKLSAVLGAAGIAGIAVGFASQTSLSNLISGLFLIWEKPFQIGDLIKTGSTQGFVHSIDLLSVKLRTFDNQFVRIPNETILKGETTNVTYFPIRRMDITIGVAYREDLETVMRVLRELADANPHCLNEPEPLIIVKEFGDSSINFMLGMWFFKTDFAALRNSFMIELKKRFDEEGIEIPFPHRTLYTGSETAPFPITIVRSDGREDATPDAG